MTEKKYVLRYEFAGIAENSEAICCFGSCGRRGTNVGNRLYYVDEENEEKLRLEDKIRIKIAAEDILKYGAKKLEVVI